MKTKRKSTPSTRLGAYLTACVGLGTLAGSADAAIVNIDISATGYNISGTNAGISGFGSLEIPDFTSAGTTLTLDRTFNLKGLSISGGSAGIAISSAFGSYPIPHRFGYGDLIGPTGSAGVQGFSGTKKLTDFSVCYGFGNYSTIEFKEPNATGFIGFENKAGDFGWLKVSWDERPANFEIIAGAYNDTPGVAIVAGELAAVPEPTSVLSTMGLLASGLMLRRRKQAA